MHKIRENEELANGTLCTLLDVGDEVLFVKLRPGGIILVWTFDDGTYFPVLRAHAMSVAKAMGRTTCYLVPREPLHGRCRVHTSDKDQKSGYDGAH